MIRSIAKIFLFFASAALFAFTMLESTHADERRFELYHEMSNEFIKIQNNPKLAYVIRKENNDTFAEKADIDELEDKLSGLRNTFAAWASTSGEKEIRQMLVVMGKDGVVIDFKTIVKKGEFFSKVKFTRYTLRTNYGDLKIYDDYGSADHYK